MLHSKYLTPEGMEITLKTLYENGWRYIFKKLQQGKLYTSIEEPHYHGNAVFAYCSGNTASLDDTVNALIVDALIGYNYIAIADHIDIVDWSTVKVDTPVLVRDYENNEWTKRHFAFYRDGKVHTWDSGVTSWSKEPTDSTSWWTYAKLSED